MSWRTIGQFCFCSPPPPLPQITDVTKGAEAKSFMSRQNAETCSEIRKEWRETKSEAAKPKPASADVESLCVESFYCISNVEIPSLPFYVGIKSLARLQQHRLINTLRFESSVWAERLFVAVKRKRHRSKISFDDL